MNKIIDNARDRVRGLLRCARGRHHWHQVTTGRDVIQECCNCSRRRIRQTTALSDLENVWLTEVDE